MNSTIGFPPADDLMDYLTEVDYNKLFNQFVTFCATVAAIVVGVVSYVSFSIEYWYGNGGRENLINFGKSVKLNVNRLADFIYFNVSVDG
jgi:hypothetical protein